MWLRKWKTLKIQNFENRKPRKSKTSKIENFENRKPRKSKTSKIEKFENRKLLESKTSKIENFENCKLRRPNTSIILAGAFTYFKSVASMLIFPFPGSSIKLSVYPSFIVSDGKSSQLCTFKLIFETVGTVARPFSPISENSRRRLRFFPKSLTAWVTMSHILEPSL